MIKVLLVDDHDLVRTGISRMLSDADDIIVVGEASNGEDAIQLAKNLNPHIVLMDVKMPGIGGLEATRKLLKLCPHIKVIALTACEEEPFPSRLLQAGASGYLTKGAALAEMIQAIRVVQVGQKYLSPEIAQQLALKSFPTNRTIAHCPFDDLSERELQVALMIMRCHKVQDISDKLFLSPKTVNSHRYRIFEKLNVHNDVELTLLAVRHGMLDTETSL